MKPPPAWLVRAGPKIGLVLAVGAWLTMALFLLLAVETARHGGRPVGEFWRALLVVSALFYSVVSALAALWHARLWRRRGTEMDAQLLFADVEASVLCALAAAWGLAPLMLWLRWIGAVFALGFVLAVFVALYFRRTRA